MKAVSKPKKTYAPHANRLLTEQDMAAQTIKVNTMQNTKEKKRIETVADIPDDFQLIQDSQDIHSVLESIGSLNYESETGSLFVKTGEGEFEAVYMTTGFVPFLTARVYQLA